MLGRLADVLDRTVRATLQRLLAILTPAITVIMGAAVAGVIASIMSAILGFNDLALAP
jgi:general secretion pathway protein F